ncbi:MAG: hypothetical protein UY92_C0001G0073 [Candidatus Magasanikbacteria bacterium GW2011_GWA2_56_11]|uniref:Uncharacterized protein n=1 Tax=Candidatus Magasanikbacteria bacterium GW2011_GWA2_56_11 TaxID=1619044 RepID=A0A0G2BBW7_9BACT|nr:MAG: hypothetical protein UY92_C0001G0073 [Candidatus Magasanikbacteria bacterium GW2011_GWA2_56_11]
MKKKLLLLPVIVIIYLLLHLVVKYNENRKDELIEAQVRGEMEDRYETFSRELATWKIFEFKEMGYKASFPDEPKYEVLKLEIEGKQDIEYERISAPIGSEAYDPEISYVVIKRGYSEENIEFGSKRLLEDSVYFLSWIENAEQVSSNFGTFKGYDSLRFELEAINTGFIYKGEVIYRPAHKSTYIIMQKDKKYKGAPGGMYDHLLESFEFLE